MQAFARFLRVLGPIALATAVGLDAWHAHGLKTSLDADAYASFGRALDQQYILGLALWFAGWRAGSAAGNKGHVLAGLLFLFALLAFCGDVYLGALGYSHPGIAPQGGSAHILAWLVFAGAEARAAR